jgi:hypothetical protein
MDYVLGFFINNKMVSKSNRVSFLKEGKRGTSTFLNTWIRLEKGGVLFIKYMGYRSTAG